MNVLRGYSFHFSNRGAVAGLVFGILLSSTSAWATLSPRRDEFSFNRLSVLKIDNDQVLGTEIGNGRKIVVNPAGGYSFEVRENMAVTFKGPSTLISFSLFTASHAIGRAVIQVLQGSDIGRRCLNEGWIRASWGDLTGCVREVVTGDSVRTVFQFPHPDNGRTLLVTVEGAQAAYDELSHVIGSLSSAKE